MFVRLLTTVVILFLLSSCIYRMPTDEDYSTVPTTNNPGIIRGSGDPSLMPGVNY